jgi:hypothetical protein
MAARVVCQNELLYLDRHCIINVIIQPPRASVGMAGAVMGPAYKAHQAPVMGQLIRLIRDLWVRPRMGGWHHTYAAYAA